jgi:hypothetical protein
MNMSSDGSDGRQGRPPEVEEITLGNIGRLGVHRRTGELYWDEQPIVTEKRFTNFERTLGVLLLIVTSVGVGAAVVQAAAAVASLAGG